VREDGRTLKESRLKNALTRSQCCADEREKTKGKEKTRASHRVVRPMKRRESAKKNCKKGRNCVKKRDFTNAPYRVRLNQAEHRRGKVRILPLQVESKTRKNAEHRFTESEGGDGPRHRLQLERGSMGNKGGRQNKRRRERRDK